MKIDRPGSSEFAPYYGAYISLVPGTDLLAILEAQPNVLRRLAEALTPTQETYAYAAGKWTVRQVVSHLIDAERVFGYRAFRIGRRDQTPLSGFDQDDYVKQSLLDDVAAVDLAEEFDSVRSGNLTFLRRLTPERWAEMGTANGNPISVRALGYSMAGHVAHHLNSLHERYGLRVD